MSDTPSPPSGPPDPAPRPVHRRRSGPVVPEKAGLAGRLAARAVYTAIRTIDASLRWQVEWHPQALEAARSGRAIFTIWHNRLALSLILYRRFIQPTDPARRLAAIVSASRDGGLLARILELFEVEPVRGSSSRRGAQAIRELTYWARQGLDLAITPDGPRGPCYRVQEGAIDVAALTGLPVIPATFRVTRRYELKSWDRFQIPLPLARCVAAFGEPVRAPREMDAALRERLRLQLQTRMLELGGDTPPG